jgi:hypothetical protein
LASFKRLAAQIFAVELDQVEGAQHRGMVVPPRAQQFEVRKVVLVNHDGVAVDDADAAGRLLMASTIRGKRSAKS